LQGRYLHKAQDNTNTKAMSRVGFEHTIPVFEWAKTIYALDRAATVIGSALCQNDGITGKDISFVASRIRRHTFYRRETPKLQTTVH
jgi:hypothetical protein